MAIDVIQKNGKLYVEVEELIQVLKDHGRKSCKVMGERMENEVAPALKAVRRGAIINSERLDPNDI